MTVARLLDKLSRLIVAACDPDKIVLFGSHAKGQATLDSDIDLLVVGDFGDSRYLRDRELRQLMWQSPVRVDLHSATPTEIEEQQTQTASFLSSVMRSGRTLYSRDRPDMPC